MELLSSEKVEENPLFCFILILFPLLSYTPAAKQFYGDSCDSSKNGATVFLEDPKL